MLAEIKKSGLDDIETIRQLTYATWPATYTDIVGEEQVDYMLDLMYNPSALENQINNLKHQFIIAYLNEKPVGFASYSPKSPEFSNIYRLHKLYVVPSSHGKGIGKQLINFIVSQIQSKAIELELNVNRLNPAVSFYKNLGFNIKHEEDNDIGQGFFMNDYVMSLLL